MLASVQDIGFGIMDSRVGAEGNGNNLLSGYRLRDNRFEGGCWPPFRI